MNAEAPPARKRREQLLMPDTSEKRRLRSSCGTTRGEAHWQTQHQGGIRVVTWTQPCAAPALRLFSFNAPADPPCCCHCCNCFRQRGDMQKVCETTTAAVACDTWTVHARGRCAETRTKKANRPAGGRGWEGGDVWEGGGDRNRGISGRLPLFGMRFLFLLWQRQRAR